MSVYSVPPRRVLVATDLSAEAGRAVERAASLAADCGADLHVVYAVPPDTAPELLEFARSELRSHLQRHTREAPGGTAVTEVRSGHTAPVILDEVAAADADLLVVGARGADGRAGVPVGGTPWNLVRASGIPMLLVRQPPATAYRTVLLAVDDTEPSRAAARLGTALFPGADHLLARSCPVPGENLLLQQGVDEDGLRQLRQAVTEQARPEVERLADELDPRPVRVLIVPGRPQDTVAELAGTQGAQLVVVGTGTQSGLGYVLLGSVARHVMAWAPCDVLVVPGVRG
ncbi:universal stress protein [Streptomyces carminius]|uniref:universal stress protein n=1 Tax=Streptomyces carminius TaxID=2665496 RepID=UPI0018ECF7E4|nr:universal stress protein [Streptomyces carminius]